MTTVAERERRRQVLARQWASDFLDKNGGEVGDQSLANLLMRWGAACANEALEKAAQTVELTTARSEGRDTTAAAIRNLKAEGVR